MIIQQFIDFLQGLSAEQKATLINIQDAHLASDLTGAFESLSDGTTSRSDIALIKAGMSGDMVIDPSTASQAATSESWKQDVTFTLKNSAGDTHTWFNATVASVLSVTDASTAGTATIDPATDAEFVNGACAVQVTGDAAAWLESETATVTLGNITVMGYTVTGDDAVVTITA